MNKVWKGKINSEWQPLAFFSKKLNSAQLNYSAFDRELLAIVLSIRHWRFMLEARQFHILTDHKPLTYALSRISEPWSARQQRSLGLIAEYTSDIRHIAGKENIVADALSRSQGDSTSALVTGNEPTEQLPSSEDEVDHFFIANISNSPVDLNLMATEQLKDLEVQQMLSLKSLKIRKTKIGNTHLFCDFSTGNSLHCSSRSSSN